MREAGMSIRAIASATGDSYGTTRNTLAGEQNCPPNEPMDGEPVDAPNPERRPAPIIGLDGKRYPKPVAKPRRRPPTETAADIARDMRRLHDRINKLIDDDRFAANRDTIACRIHPYDAWLLETVARLHESLSGET
ncbi:hypothetical protein [Mycobacterium sp. 23]|uniref:hypothetical protein n=1 Tax=Mycobacterium sp. 23 TaxID=3400424 RepID=UPI003AABBB00